MIDVSLPRLFTESVALSQVNETNKVQFLHFLSKIYQLA